MRSKIGEKKMKNINSYLLSLIFLLTSASLFARQYPPGEGDGAWVKYRYTVGVKDQNNNPKANVKVRLVATYTVYQSGYPTTHTVYKDQYTNSYDYPEIWVDMTP